MRIIHYSAEHGNWEAVAILDDEPGVESLDLVTPTDQHRDGFTVDFDIEIEIIDPRFMPAFGDLYVKQLWGSYND